MEQRASIWTGPLNRALITILLILHGSFTVRAQDLKKIKIGYPAISYNQIHIWIAKDAGLFRKFGLDPEIIFFRGGQLATQALVAGDPPIVNIGTVVQAGLQGHDIVLIASSESAYNYSIVARPAITKVEQLKGKRLGISGFGSASHNAALILFRKFGLEPNKDIFLAVTGFIMYYLVTTRPVQSLAGFVIMIAGLGIYYASRLGSVSKPQYKT